MKHLILTSALFLTATLGFAQNITEPEYKGQVAVINTDSNEGSLPFPSRQPFNKRFV